ncbi:conserved hypothetical cytosolic protein [Candidatus Moduliflexus flocculans]|uniref:Conserved hypothetical cytosolic protein n=1 Tax=Candidatus Moduliflexus flocculans TaxID=1499966 RepID=A0A081BT30_9BACT|nr:conserved hypothetical cytosolic protein [Candidatus Moduliflexus flocculans]
MDQDKDQSFRVTDKRSSARQDTDTMPPSPPETETHKSFTQAAEPSMENEAMPFPEASFMTLIFSLYTHAQITLGVIPDPMTQQMYKDLEQAKYNIDLLDVLKDKTRGNLTTEEEQTLEQMLYEVRMAYLTANK